MKLKVYVIGGLILVVFLAIAFLQFGGMIKNWTHKDDVRQVQDLLKKEKEELVKQKALNDQTLQEYEVTQTAVRNLSKVIMDLRKEADKNKQDAMIAIQKQQAKDSVVLSLDQKVKQLEAELKQKRTEITSLQEAQNELVKYGIK